MAAGVVLDTSFLISLASDQRAHHEAARKYWRHFTENGIPLFLPTIVVSEFCIKQELPPDILRSCVVLPFNWDDALKAASLHGAKGDGSPGSRDAIKDDLKILAQAIVKDAAWVITDDGKTFFKIAKRLKDEGVAGFRALKLEDGFDLSMLHPDGQHQMDFDANPDESDPPA